MSDRSQAFLARIGLRPLTHEEARQLLILRIKEGTGSAAAEGVIKKLAEEARRALQPKPDDTATDGV